MIIVWPDFSLSLLCWIWHNPEVGFHLLKPWEQLLCFIVLDGWQDNAVISSLPVGRCGNFMLVSQLKRVNGSEKFIEVATSAWRVVYRETDLVVLVDYIAAADQH